MKWKHGGFFIRMREGRNRYSLYRMGWLRPPFGICWSNQFDRSWCIVHLPSKLLVSCRYRRLNEAKKLVDQLLPLLDWSVKDPWKTASAGVRRKIISLCYDLVPVALPIVHTRHSQRIAASRERVPAQDQVLPASARERESQSDCQSGHVSAMKRGDARVRKNRVPAGANRHAGTQTRAGAESRQPGGRPAPDSAGCVR